MEKPKRGRLIIDTTYSYHPRALRLLDPEEGKVRLLNRWVKVDGDKIRAGRVSIGRGFTLLPKSLALVLSPNITSYFDLSGVDSSDWLLFYGTEEVGRLHWAEEVYNLGPEPRIDVKTLLEEGEEVDEKGQLKVYETPDWLVKALFSQIKTPVPYVIDLTAGSGEAILSAFDSNPALKNSKLLGFELRKLEPKDKRNRVIYGANVLNYFRGASDFFILPKGFYFANPPYTAKRLFEKLYMNSIPIGSVVAGVYPLGALGILERKLTGMGVIVPIPDWEGSPERVVVFAGTPRNKEGQPFSVRELPEDATVEEVIKAVQEVGRTADWLLKGLEFLKTPPYRRLKEIYERGEKLNREDFEIIKKRSEEVFNLFSPVQKAVSGEEIFPDQRIFNSPKRLSLFQVANDAVYLSFVKEVDPSTYRFIVSAAKEVGLPIKEEKGEKEYATTPNLGLVKFRYYPKVIPINDKVISVIEELLKEKEGDLSVIPVLKGLKGKGKIVVKSVMGGDSSGGMNIMGYTPTLAVVNEDGLEHSAIFLSLADFYRRLEEEGVIDIGDKVEVIEESREEKETIIKGFLRLVDEVKRIEGIGEIPEEEVREFFREKNKLVYAVKKATEKNLSYPSLIKDPDIEKAAFKEVKEYLKSIGYKGDINLSYIKRFTEAVKDKLYGALFTYKEKTLQRLFQAVKKDNPEISDALAYELAKRTLDGAVSEFVFQDVKRKGLARVMATIYYAERIGELLDKGEVDKAYEELKYSLFGNIYGLRIHQIEESFRLIAKWLRTKEGGHILGWEMRAGKTLAMLNTALLSYAVSGKEVIFSPKTANLNDILLQMSERLPLLTYFAEAYESGDTSPILNGDRKKTLPFREVFPNPFAIARGKLARVFTKAGKTAEEELQTYALTMEELIEEAEKISDPLSKIDENSPFAFIKGLDGYSEAVRLAFYWYMDAMARQGKIITNGGLFEEFKKKLKAKSDEVKRLIEEDFESKQSFPVKIVPKPLALSFNYEVELQESFKLAGVKITLLRDVKVKDAVLKKTAPPPDYVVESLREEGRVILPEGFLLDAPYDYEDFFTRTTVEIGGLRVDGYRLKEFEEIEKDLEGEVDRESLRERYEEALKKVEEQSILDGKRLFRLIEEGDLPYWVEKVGEEAIVPVVLSGIQIRDRGIAFLKETKNPENPALKTLSPAGVKAALKLSGKRKVKIKEIIVNDPDFPPLKRASTSNAKHYFVRKRELEGLGAVIIDEVDESVNPNSSLTYRSYHYACSHAEVKVGGTGTPTSGYPEDLVALSGLVSGMPIDTIRATTGIVRDFYSAWEFSNSTKGTVGSFFYDILVNSSPEDFKELVSLTLSYYGNPLRAGEAFLSFVAQRSSDPVIYSQVEDILSSKEDKKGKGELERIGEIAVKLAEGLAEKIEGFNTTPALTSIFLEVGTRLGIISRTPGTLDPVGLVSVLRGASFSFNTREQLKSIAAGEEVKEVLEFDTENLNFVAKNLKALPEEFAPDSAGIRYLVDIELPKKYSEDGLYDLYRAIQLFASYLQKAVEENPQPLCELFGLEERELMLLVSKRGKTATDDLKSMITKTAVYGIDSLDADEEKKKFVAAVMARASEIEKLYGISDIAVEEYRKKNPDASKEELEEVKTFVQDGAGDCSYALANPLNEEITLFRKIWEEAVRPDFEGFTLTYSPVASDTAVIDAFSNAGYFEELSRLAETGESYLLTSPRVESLKTAIIDAVANIVKAKKEGKGAEETVILVRLTQASIKEAIDALDLEKLEKFGITVKTFETPSALDAESKRYKKPLLLQKELEKEGELERRKLQLVVVSTDTAIARGVDLSHLDEIVSYGITPSGKTATQLYARLFNATDKNEGKVYLIGKPYKYLKVFNNVNVYPSSIFYGGAKLLKKVEFVKATLSGEAVNLTAKKQLGKVVPGNAKKEIESRLALSTEPDNGGEIEL